MNAINEPDFDWLQAAFLSGEDPDQVESNRIGVVVELIESSGARFEELKARNAVTERAGMGPLAHQLRGGLLNFGFTALVGKAQAAFAISRKMLGTRHTSLGIS